MASDAYDKVLTMVDSTVNNAWQLLNHLQLYSRDNLNDGRSDEVKQSVQRDETSGRSAAFPSSKKQSSKTKVQHDESSGTLLFFHKKLKKRGFLPLFNQHHPRHFLCSGFFRELWTSKIIR